MKHMILSNSNNCSKSHKHTTGKWLSIAAVILLIVMIPLSSYAESERLIAVASDRHGNTEAIGQAMAGMPKSVEYVCLIGDMVGDVSFHKNDEASESTHNDFESSESTHNDFESSMKPEFNTSEIFNEVLSLGFAASKPMEDISILWASHDQNAVDDSGIMFGADGTGSGVMKTGINEDGSAAYYIYGIAFNDMAKEENAETAAADFKAWIDTLDENDSAPVFVFCHMPLHYARKDNKGGTIWSKALNYAATGVDSNTLSLALRRNVVFMHGHNHSTETNDKYSGEFYVPAGSFIETGAAEGTWGPAYYTYVTAGYLDSNTSATLLSVGRDFITVTKYQNGAPALIYDVVSRKSGFFANLFSIRSVNRIRRVNAREDSPIKASGATRTVKYSKLKKKALTVKGITVKNAESAGTLNYTKVSGKARFTVNKKNSKIKIRKGTKKGTYKVKVRVTASGTDTYQPGSKTATVTIKVK